LHRFLTAAIKEQKLANYFGRKVAIDASMTIYQFAVKTHPDPPCHQTVSNALPFLRSLSAVVVSSSPTKMAK